MMLFNTSNLRANSPCPRLMDPIEFSIQTEPTSINYNLNINQRRLQSLAKRSLISPSNRRVLGLTSTKNTLSSNIGTKTYRLSKNNFCTRITSLKLTIKVHKIDLYVLNKYKRGSCQYTAVLDHEHEHVAIYQSGLKKLETALKKNLGQQLRYLPASFGLTPQTSQKRVISNIKVQISKIERPIIQEMRRKDRQIDSPTNYRKLTQKCTNW